MPKEPQKPDPTERKDAVPPAHDPADAATENERHPGLKYVFKVAPVDGKNSIDFEDIADK